MDVRLAGGGKRFPSQGPVKASALGLQGARDAVILSVRYAFSGVETRLARETFFSAHQPDVHTGGSKSFRFQILNNKKSQSAPFEALLCD